MASPVRLALSIIVTMVIIAVTIIMQVLLSPLIAQWLAVLASSGVIGSEVGTIAFAVYRVSLFLIAGGSIVWCVINGFSSENSESPYLQEFGRL